MVKGLRKITVDLCLFTGFLTLYLYTLTSYYTYDAVSYALSIRIASVTGEPAPLFHPHHLLFNSLGMVLWKLFSLLDMPVGPLRTLQLMNAFAGALGIVVIYRFLLAVTKDVLDIPDTRWSVLSSMSAAAALGVSFGYWIAATDGRANMIGIVISFVFIYIAYNTALRPNASSSAFLGLFASLALLFHQSHGLLFVVGLTSIWIVRAKTKRKLRYSLWFLGIFSIVCALFYVAASSLRGISGLSGFTSWTTTYAQSSQWWSFNIIDNLWADVRALVHAYVADPLIVRNMPSYQVFNWGFISAPFVLFIAYAYRAVGSRFGRDVTAFCPQGIKGGMRQEATTLGDPGQSFYVFNSICLVWAMTYACFFSFWSAGYFIFWIPMAAAGICLVAVNGTAYLRNGLPIALFFALWAVSLFIVNFYGHILPKMNPERNGYLMMARAVEKYSIDGDVVLLTGVGYMAEADIYVPYFSQRNVVSLHQLMQRHRGFKPGALDWLSNLINKKLKTGQHVLVFSEVLNSNEAWQTLEGRYGIEPDDVKQVLSKYRMVPKFKWKDQTVYTLKR